MWTVCFWITGWLSWCVYSLPRVWLDDGAPDWYYVSCILSDGIEWQDRKAAPGALQLMHTGLWRLVNGCGLLHHRLILTCTEEEICCGDEKYISEGSKCTVWAPSKDSPSVCGSNASRVWVWVFVWCRQWRWRLVCITAVASYGRCSIILLLHPVTGWWGLNLSLLTQTNKSLYIQSFFCSVFSFPAWETAFNNPPA